MKNKKVTILVSSFDGFSDCWEPFLYSFKTYWSECKYDIYLITNELNSPDENILPSIKVDEDLGWASNLIKALNHIETDYVIYLQEDFWLDKKVNHRNLENYISKFEENNWQFFRISPLTVPKEFLKEKIFPTSGKYRLTLQATIWEKDFLQSLLFEGESGWDFEAKSTERLVGLDVQTYCINSELDDNFIMSYCWGTAVRKGKWTKAAIDFVKNENFDFDLTKRKWESKSETYLIKLSGKSFFLKLVSFLIIRIVQFFNGERSFISIFSR